MSKILTCKFCYRQLPEEDFVDGNVRCKFCVAAIHHDQATESLEAKAQEVLARVLDAGEAISPIMPAVQETVTEIYNQFGGPRGFAQKVTSYLNKQLSLPKPPGHCGTLLLGLLKVQLQVEAQRETVRVNDMTDEQIKREQALEMAKMFMANVQDPVKRKNLEETLNTQGLTLQNLSPETIVEHAANSTLETTE